ncbi:MAG TPA: RNA polymerase sigma factor [Polyangiaceae bacterium]
MSLRYVGAVCCEAVTSPPDRESGIRAFSGRIWNELELVEGLSRAQPAAAYALYNQYAASVRRLLIQLFGSVRDIDDLVQETMLVVIKRVSALRKAQSFRAFVMGVAIHLARNELRKRNARRFIALEGADDIPLTYPHDEATAELARHLYRALDKMSFESRSVIVLKFVQGYELTELAAACSCSIATVKRRLAHAERHLVSLVEGDPVLREVVRGSLARRVSAA